MNKQAKANGGRGIEWTDYTWNPIGGCLHACQWTMPDGTVANCYAEDTAERSLAKQFYPEGFEHHYWRPQLLSEPQHLKNPAKIFCGSMADVFGHWVPKEQIYAVLDVAQTKAQQHVYQFLTKNPKRYLEPFDFTANMWAGASTPPDFMWNKPLSADQKARMLDVTLSVFDELQDEPTTWLSAEPLSWDITPVLANHPYAVDWIVIGAASNGSKYYPPEEEYVVNLVELCDEMNISVFFKGNLKSLRWAAEHWREDYPAASVAWLEQKALFS